jgi:hypothetical protein
MNRQQVIAKIKSMLKLQESTDFDGEASAAASMIDKLCAKYGITLQEATEVIATDEQFSTFKKMDEAYAILLNAVANFYDAKAYINNSVNGKSFNVIGSEAQQIQVNLYFEYLLEVMNREADKAYLAEKVIAELTGKTTNRSFKVNFKKAFSRQVQERLIQMKKDENRVHEDKNAVDKALSTRRFGRGRSMKGAVGDGAGAGANVGSGVSLNRQASGSTAKQLCGV